MAAMNQKVPENFAKPLPKVHDLFSPKQENSFIQACKMSVMVEIGLL